MSTSPENELVNVLSHWLARHIGNAELLRELEAVRETLEAVTLALEPHHSCGVTLELVEARSLRTSECDDER
jgi:hypothetical protein